MKILDTDHCIAILRGKLNPRPFITPEEELALTTINLAELVYGALKSARPGDNLARLDVFLSSLTMLPFEETSARRYAELRSRLEIAGHRLADLDLQIASIALTWNVPLVSHNQSHFSRLSISDGLKLEDWISTV